MEIVHDKMTVVYSKSTGMIKQLHQGEQKAELIFGDEYDDLSQIYDLLILDYDDYAFKHAIVLKVVDGALKFKDSETAQKYI